MQILSSSMTQKTGILPILINGHPYFQKGKSLLQERKGTLINHFRREKQITPDALQISDRGSAFPVIDAIDGSLITEKSWASLPTADGYVLSDPTCGDVLKICVVNRYAADVLRL